MVFCIECKTQGVLSPKTGKPFTAGYGLPNGKRTHCTRHKSQDMVNLANKTNLCIECQPNFTNAHFGLLEDGKRISCSKHKTLEMVNLANRSKCCVVCKEKKLFNLPTFGYLEDRKITHCRRHKEKDMVNLANLHHACIVCLNPRDKQIKPVFTHSSFGRVGGRADHCAKHKTDDMIDLAHPKCECGTIASFGLLTNGKLIACAKHKTDQMVDLVNINNGCIVCGQENYTRASFGFELDGKKTHCSNHKKQGMINLADINKKCLECEKFASFGLIDDLKRTHCSKHKTDEMINLAKRKQGCVVCKETKQLFKHASYGYPDDRKMTHCGPHRLDGMIDLKNNNCELCQTFVTASYGRLFEKKTHCFLHKLDNEYLNNNPTCEKCDQRPLFGQEQSDLIPKRCEKHKKQTDIDMLSRTCEMCDLDYFIPSTQTKCADCLGWELEKRNKRGVKEQRIANCLSRLSETTGLPIPINNRTITEGCSKRRPDFYYKDFNDLFSLIVEVDEHQHCKYTCSIIGEIRRMIAIYEEDSGGFPLIFIRFNPDPYYLNEEIVEEYAGREEKLVEVINSFKNRDQFDYKIAVIYLYYDNFKTASIKPLDYQIENGMISVVHDHPLADDTEFTFKI